ncbi:hypothetical protein H257_08052 [Aphanomyces astaci]|uniref:Uncharacterized protein n=1 Tax=Aphanomyces astaci TaxID=112090 RepID=W4GH02_APHAT|nr:hypothetical protein H257_08052 [Aphanomyces astaci]ETV78541.1 hypothetical protein H257_08052 [Aphanomyces astaci]|eukprot:XP_009832122.1 hypothetical protein H257_08052 [Aphanomyces astaci]
MQEGFVMTVLRFDELAGLGMVDEDAAVDELPGCSRDGADEALAPPAGSDNKSHTYENSMWSASLCTNKKLKSSYTSHGAVSSPRSSSSSILFDVPASFKMSMVIK